MKAFTFLSGFFKDQNGSASSKRLTLYICLAYLGLLVNGSLKGQPINAEVLFLVGGIILFSIGAVTSEFFAKNDRGQTE